MSAETDLAEMKADVRHTNKTMERVAKNVEKLTEFMVESSAQARATDEKFLRLHEQIDNVGHRTDENTHSINTMMTEIIPDLERDAAVKGQNWKIAGAVAVPICTVVGTGLWWVAKLQAEALTSRAGEAEALASAIAKAIAAAAGAP
jgi:hypothetical protein